jgi:hypothetical protein
VDVETAMPRPVNFSKTKGLAHISGSHVFCRDFGEFRIEGRVINELFQFSCTDIVRFG